MAIRSGFFNSINGDRKYDAGRFAEYFNSFIGNGVFPNPSTNLQVIANNDMTITVKAGKAWINGYILVNDDDYILELDPADGVLNRTDRIVARYDVVDREITLEVKKGTFASEPTAPILQRDADAYELGLADIAVNKGAISIAQANITDLRLNSELCGIVHGTVEQIDTTTLFLQYEDGFNTWFESIRDTLGEDIAGNLLNMINATDTNLTNLQQDFTVHQADYVQLKENLNDSLNYSTYKLDVDDNGIFKEIQYKRADGTLILKSILSGGISPKYTTRTETEYESDGITVKANRVYAITYDTDGKVISEVLQ